MVLLSKLLSAFKGAFTPTRAKKRSREGDEEEQQSKKKYGVSEGGMTDLNASAPLEKRQPAALQEQGGGTAAKYADLLPSVSVGAKNGGFVWRQFPSPTSTVKTARRDDLPGGDIGSAVQLVENPVHGSDSILLSKSIGYHVPMSNPSDHSDRHDALKSTQERDRSKKNPAAHADFYGRFLDRLQSMMDVHEKRILERRYSKGIESPKDAYRYHYDRVQSLTKRASSLLDYSSAQRIQNELNEVRFMYAFVVTIELFMRFYAWISAQIEENISRIRKLRLEPKAGPGFKRVVPLPKISDGDLEKFEELTRSRTLTHIMRVHLSFCPVILFKCSCSLIWTNVETREI